MYKKADVIIYDHLANPTLLSYAKNDCKLIYAGKIAGNHHMVQEEINKTLVEHSRFGNVVRLKGGDPFHFLDEEERNWSFSQRRAFLMK